MAESNQSTNEPRDVLTLTVEDLRMHKEQEFQSSRLSDVDHAAARALRTAKNHDEALAVFESYQLDHATQFSEFKSAIRKMKEAGLAGKEGAKAIADVLHGEGSSPLVPANTN